MDTRNLISVAGSLFLLSGCADVLPPQVGTSVGTGAGTFKQLVVTTTDFGKNGELIAFDLASGKQVGKSLPIYSDAVVRSGGAGKPLAVLNRRGQDNLQGIGSDFGSVSFQRALPGWVNLQDVAWGSDSVAWLSSLERNGIARLDLATGGVKEISFAGARDTEGNDLVDADGSPEPSWMKRIGGSLWVVFARLDRRETYFPPRRQAMVGIVDLKSEELVKVLPLHSPNPVSQIKSGPDGSLYLCEAGYIGKEFQIDGALERFDAVRQVSLGAVTSENKLGGDIYDVEILTADLGVAIVSYPDKQEIVKFDPKSGDKISALPPFPAYALSGLALDRSRGLLFVADGTRSAPSIRVFEIGGMTEKAEMRFPLRLLPFHMELVE